MCPYYNESGKYCKIYKTTQNDYNDKAYCQECINSYKDCPNFKQFSKVYNGNPPAPSNY